VDAALNMAGVTDARYGKAVKEVGSVLTKLMDVARELEEQHPEMLRLVMDFEAAATLESGLAAEIAYREGMKDCSSVSREFATFMQKQLSS
jgi:hypothetical protein